MTPQELLRRLITRAPPDVLAAIYERVREVRGKGPSWAEIARAAQGLGIFTPEEANAFLRLLGDRLL